MQFENEVQEETHHKLKQYLPELFDEPLHEPENGHFYVRYGSTVLEVSNEPYGPEECVVKVMSYCVQGVEIDEELRQGLLELNHRRPFGAFSVIGQDIYFSYSIFGRSMTPANLLGAVAAVATVADDYDDRIVARYGGQTALDLIRDTGGWRKRRARDLGEEDPGSDKGGPN